MTEQLTLKKENSIYKKVILLGIYVVGLLIRLYRIPYFQIGLHVDEASIGYDAFCIANYGVDRHLYSYPLLFPGFGGGGHSALYTYCCALLVKIAGSNIYTLRLPAVFFSMITVIAGTCIVRELFHNTGMEIGYAMMTSFFPYFFLASRFGLDCNLMLGTSTVFLYFFIKAANTGKKYFFILAGIGCGLILYTYSLAYLVVPFFLAVSLWYVVINKRITVGKAILFLIPLVIMASPLIVIQYINISDGMTMVWGPFTLPKLEGYRGGDLSYPRLASFAKAVFVSLFYDDSYYNSIPKWLNLYVISLPFLLTGYFRLWNGMKKRVKEKEHNALDYILFWVLAQLLVGSMIRNVDGTTVNRMNGIFMCYVVLILYGIRVTVSYLKNSWKKIGIAALSLAYLCMSIFFYKDILEDQTMKYLFDNNYEEGIRDLREEGIPENIPTVMIVTDGNLIFYRYAAKLDPFKYQDINDIPYVYHSLEETEQNEPHVCIVDHEQSDAMTNLRNDGDYAEKEYERYSVFHCLGN